MDIRIPRLGEGISSGTVVNVLVKEGEAVTKDQTVIELETEKAVAPIPATEDGTVSKILVKQGDVVAVGQSVISMGGASGAPAPAKEKKAPEPPSSAPQQTQSAAPRPQTTTQEPTSEDYSYESKSGVPPPASPTVRKVAKDLGIDLHRVKGSEHGGRIVMEDLKAYVQRLQQRAGQPSATAQGTAKPSAPPAESVDFSKWGPVTKKPITNLRKTIGNKMVESWTTVPHVTQFDEADITNLLALRKKYAPAYEKKGAKLTVTSFIIKIVAEALKKHPLINSSLDEATSEIVLKQYYHLGVAVDTENGLIVPVLKDVDKKDYAQVSIELAQLAEKTRQRKISIDEISGGTFNISNLGSIGGTFFTPIVTRPQVAVLGVGRGVQRPIVKNGKVEIASMLPLGLSYDHRVIDGADGARFIREIVERLENIDEKVVKI
jgi:pyruvate dehydrogenase E2 component (dihydrolipoamide acetyltransferase)